ncbi:MAG: hypothetical protein IKS55_12505, partial [Oscillospiraceae bacterium]|nr:hypothetical protein [Oscillospiraceae bacterium]
RETGISHSGFSAALAPHKLHIVSLPRSVGKARSFRCSSLPMETHFVGLSIGFSFAAEVGQSGAAFSLAAKRYNLIGS